MWAHLALVLASDWSRAKNDVRTGTGSHMTGSDWKWGGHVFWDGKPLTSGKKRMAGSGNRKSRVLGWETAEQFEKGIVGSGWGKTAE